MKRLALFGLLGLVLVGCQGESADEKKLDTQSPTANLPAPPPSGIKKNIPTPPTAGGPGGGGNATPSAAPAPAPSGG